MSYKVEQNRDALVLNLPFEVADNLWEYGGNVHWIMTNVATAKCLAVMYNALGYDVVLSPSGGSLWSSWFGVMTNWAMRDEFELLQVRRDEMEHAIGEHVLNRIDEYAGMLKD